MAVGTYSYPGIFGVSVGRKIPEYEYVPPATRRSAVVVAAHLMEACGIGAGEAIALVAAKREINVTPALVDLIRKLEA